MLICTNSENDFTSFKNKDIDTFVQNHADASLEKLKVLKSAMDSLDKKFENNKIPVTSIPMVLYSGYSVKKGKRSFSKLIDIINKFLESYDMNEEYKKFVQNRTLSSENISEKTTLSERKT